MTDLLQLVSFETTPFGSIITINEDKLIEAIEQNTQLVKHNKSEASINTVNITINQYIPDDIADCLFHINVCISRHNSHITRPKDYCFECESDNMDSILQEIMIETKLQLLNDFKQQVQLVNNKTIERKVKHYSSLDEYEYPADIKQLEVTILNRIKVLQQEIHQAKLNFVIKEIESDHSGLIDDIKDKLISNIKASKQN